MTTQSRGCIWENPKRNGFDATGAATLWYEYAEDECEIRNYFGIMVILLVDYL